MKKTFCFIILLLTTSLFSQQQKWTLQQCLDYAHEHNLQLKQSRLNIKQAEIELQNSKMAYLPNLNFSSSGSWNQNLYTDAGAQNNIFNSNASVSSGMSLFEGYKNKYNYKKSALEMKSATHEYANFEGDMDIQVVMAYLNILLNKENLASLQAQLENSIRQKEKTQAMIDAGVLPKGDIADAEAQITNDNLQVIQAENTYKLARLNLAQLLEIEDFNTFDISDEIGELQIDESLLHKDPQTLFLLGLQNDDKIKIGEFQKEISGYQIKLAKSASYPQLSANAGLSTGYSDFQPMDLTGSYLPATDFGQQIKDNLQLNYGLNISIPIFNGVRIKNQIKSAQLKAEQYDISFENDKKQLRNEVYQMHQDLEAAFQSMQAAEANLNAQRKSYDYALEKFKVGMLNIFDLNTIKTKYVKAESQYINAKYQYYLKAKILEFTVN